MEHMQWQCDKCGRYFETKRGLSMHQNSCKGDEVPKIKKKMDVVVITNLTYHGKPYSDGDVIKGLPVTDYPMLKTSVRPVIKSKPVKKK